MNYRLVDFFTDPILRAPMLGSLFMCIAASLIGVCVFVRKRSLVGEATSHAAYPGLVAGAMIASLCGASSPDEASLFFLLGAFLSSMFGLWLLGRLQNVLFVKNDAALCFVLSSLFGVGILLASHLQFSHPVWCRQVQVFLYGQTATLLDIHVWIYLSFLLGVVLFLFSTYRYIKFSYFDSLFAGTLGISVKVMDRLFFVFLGLGVTLAMKSVGVVLLSGMLVAPALAARQFSRGFCSLFVLSSIFGAASAFLGNYFSVKITEWIPGHRLLFPTGPAIVLFGSFFAFSSLFFVRLRRTMQRRSLHGR